MNERERKELALSKVLILSLIVVCLIAVVWLAWFHPLPLPKAAGSFAACVKAGNPVQETYPETCVTKDGKHFTNESQRNYLTIDEWQVRLPYPANVHSLSYRIDSADANLAHIQLDDVQGECKGANQLRRAKSGQNLDGLGKTPESYLESPDARLVRKISNYYYLFTTGTPCTREGQDYLQEQIDNLSKGLQGKEINKLEPAS